MKPISYRALRKILLASGFDQMAQTGSHVKFAKRIADGTRTAIVPKHREIALGTLRSILRQAGLTPEEFEKL